MKRFFQYNQDNNKSFIKINAFLDSIIGVIKSFNNVTISSYKVLYRKKTELKKQNELLAYKEELLSLQSEKLQAKEEELTTYINKMFEQQERERIVKWLANSIRESLDLDIVIKKTVEEVGCLLKVDRCLIALYDEKTDKFTLQGEYKSDENINSIITKVKEVCIPVKWNKRLLKYNNPIVINETESLVLEKNDNLNSIIGDTKSFIITGVAYNDVLLGIIIMQQVSYNREWGVSHIEVLKDIGNQIAIAIKQASLYTEVQEMTRLKSEFLASMSHEFRTPLNAIIGFSDMLKSGNYGELSQKQKEYLNNISISGKHLLRLVNDVLDLSKIESGNMDLYYDKFDSSKVIDETICSLICMIIKKNISIKQSLCKAALKADEGRFRQIMYNLLSNAVKFTEENGIITVNTFVINGELKVEVEDTGIGISENHRNKIFMEFSQIDSSYARKQEGTGLGLTLTKKLIELHGGQIDFESELGKGTKFWFILPNAELIETPEAQKISEF